jgi:hypothetical protein
MTQYAAIASLVFEAILYKYRAVINLTRMSIFLMIAISLTLFITGAGPFAFDLPI